jgi:hypothetical protein
LEQQNYKVQQVSTIMILRLQPIISVRKVNSVKEVLEMYIRYAGHLILILHRNLLVVRSFRVTRKLIVKKIFISDRVR